jgi:hypothetical protein
VGATAADPAYRRADYALTLLMVVLYAPLLFFGYGSDNDAYLVLDSGRGLITHHTYAPSRNPGYFLFEATIGLLSRLGGSVLCNAATLVVGAAALLCFLRVCRQLRLPRPHLLGVLFVVHPVVWVNATCTMDYVWALALLLTGLLLVLRRAYLAAGVVLGLAVAMRSTSFIAAGLVLAFALIGRREDRGRVALAGGVAVVLAALFYLPSFRYAGNSLAFLQPMTGGDEFWTPRLRLGRFVYKNVYLWGLPASMILPVLLLLGRRSLSDTRWRPVVLGCAAVVVAYEALFLTYPIEIAYLLPLVPAALILLGIALAERPVLLKVFAGVLASYAVINLNIARPDNPMRATWGTVGWWVEPGFVLRDARDRAALRHCDTYACWEKVAGSGRPASEAPAVGN